MSTTSRPFCTWKFWAGFDNVMTLFLVYKLLLQQHGVSRGCGCGFVWGLPPGVLSRLSGRWRLYIGCFPWRFRGSHGFGLWGAVGFYMGCWSAALVPTVQCIASFAHGLCLMFAGMFMVASDMRSRAQLAPPGKSPKCRGECGCTAKMNFGQAPAHVPHSADVMKQLSTLVLVHSVAMAKPSSEMRPRLTRIARSVLVPS